MQQQLESALATIIYDLFGIKTPVTLSRTDEKFGDYATNVALKLSGQLGRSPRDIASEVVGKITTDLTGQVLDAQIAGPGFINITLTAQALVSTIGAPIAKSWENKKVLVEYSDPNPFKPLHAGHLYTTLVGDAIARLLEASGATVIRLNYGGDVGLHVGKTMWAIVKTLGGELPDKLANISAAERPYWLGEQYVLGNNAYESDESVKAEIIAVNARIYEIHNSNDHESPLAQIYWAGRTWSYDYFRDLYDQLQVKPFDRMIPESEIVPLGLQTVHEQLQKGVYQTSEGAVVFKGEPYGLHTRVFINSKGLPTYEAKDVGLLMTKWQDYHFDRSIVITSNEQQQYMEVMLKSVEQFAPELVAKSEHKTHGVVKLAGGVKMSSRKGNTAGALQILEAAAAANLEATGQDNTDTVLGAVKYAFLKNRIGGDIIYDPAESVSLEGNSGPYLQYAYARACSILAKADTVALSDDLLLELLPSERQLAFKLSQYGEVVARAAAELMPHHVCGYLYELAQTFNRFYENNRVIGSDRQANRLKLVEVYAQTLQAGLELLGLPTPTKM